MGIPANDASSARLPTEAARPTERSGSAGRLCVVHLIHTMAYGGIETIVINWLLGADRHQFDMRVVCFANPGGTERHFVEMAAQQGIHVDTIPWGRHKPIWRASRAFATYLRQHQAAVVHTHNTYADVVGWLAARGTHCKTVASLYVWGEFGLKRNLLQWCDTRVLRWFDHVTCQCEKTRIDTLARGIPAEQTSVLGAGLETTQCAMTPAERRAARQQWGASDDHCVLVNVARLYPEKAQRFLLDSFAQLLQSVPQARLWIAGVGPLEDELKSHCTSLGLDPYVRWLGFLDDLPRLFALSDIQVHPSFNEGVPLALLHGMAAGMPIVATAVGGVPEVIHDGEQGLLVPVEDQTAFVQAVQRVMNDRTLAEALGQRAQAFIEHEYNQSKSLRELQQLYVRLTSP